jgi:hypothetical protein
MAVMVEECTKTKSGKGLRVKLSGTWYNAFLDSGLDQQVGRLIEAEIRTHDKYGAGVVGWKPVSGVTPVTSAPPPQAAAPLPSVSAPPLPAAGGAPPAFDPDEPVYAKPSDNVAPWWMPFVSNTVAHAIEKGLIGTPEAINQWALKAAQVAVAIKEQCK